MLSALFIALAKTGARPWIGDDEARDVGLIVGSERVKVHLDHPDAKPDREGRYKTREGFADVLRLAIVGTPTDVAQRLRAFNEEDCEEPNPALRVSCLAIYEAEKSEGTELAAIIGRLRQHVNDEETRRIHDDWERQKQEAQEKRLALEQSFLAGEDCKWTPIAQSEDVYCRANGRAYRLSAKQGNTRNLFRVSGVDDPTPRLIGKYQNRTDATKALTKIAYQHEPRS